MCPAPPSYKHKHSLLQRSALLRQQAMPAHWHLFKGQAMTSVKELIENVGVAIDVAGVAIIALGAVYSAARALLPRGKGTGYAGFRQNLGRSILLGLELLVAADIVRTVAVAPTMESVLILGIIVVIRTVLSMTLQVELDGKWPWQRSPDTHLHSATDTSAPRQG